MTTANLSRQGRVGSEAGGRGARAGQGELAGALMRCPVRPPARHVPLARLPLAGRSLVRPARTAGRRRLAGRSRGESWNKLARGQCDNLTFALNSPRPPVRPNGVHFGNFVARNPAGAPNLARAGRQEAPAQAGDPQQSQRTIVSSRGVVCWDENSWAVPCLGWAPVATSGGAGGLIQASKRLRGLPIAGASMARGWGTARAV